MCNLQKRLIRAAFWVLLQAMFMKDWKQPAQRLKLRERLLTINEEIQFGETRNSQGVETCNSHMFALSDARDYSFSKVPYLEREEEITDQSNFVNNVT